MNSKTIFLDRDGVLNVEGGDYITNPKMLAMLPDSAEAVALLNRAGWKIILVTNQAGVGRGYMSVTGLEAVHFRLKLELEKAGAHLDAIYYCPHTPEDECGCRKPEPGMLLQAAREHDLNLSQCWLAGDSSRDMEAGNSVGCKTILVLSGHTKIYLPSKVSFPPPVCIAANLYNAVEWMLSEPIL